MGFSFARVLLYILYIFIIIVGLFFTIIGGLFFSQAFKASGICTPPTSVVNIAHRGDTSISQENTIAGGVSAVTNGYGTEFDIYQISTGELVIFHDSNALVKTGTDLDIESATLEEIRKLRYKSTINGYSYNESPSVPLLSEFLAEVCKADKDATLDFDLKFSPNSDTMKALMDIIDASPCSCDPVKQKMYFATPYFYVGSNIRKGFEGRRCKTGKVSIYFHPGSLPLGVYFWLKTRYAINVGDADIVNTHYKVWNFYPELLTGFNEDKYCTANYGGTLAEMKDLNITEYRVIDMSIASQDEEITYDGDSSGYKALIAMTIIGVLLLALGLFLLIFTCGNCICKKKDA